jgi:hypothetical protein
MRRGFVESTSIIKIGNELREFGCFFLGFEIKVNWGHCFFSLGKISPNFYFRKNLGYNYKGK